VETSDTLSLDEWRGQTKDCLVANLVAIPADTLLDLAVENVLALRRAYCQASGPRASEAPSRRLRRELGEARTLTKAANLLERLVITNRVRSSSAVWRFGLDLPSPPAIGQPPSLETFQTQPIADAISLLRELADSRVSFIDALNLVLGEQTAASIRHADKFVLVLELLLIWRGVRGERLNASTVNNPDSPGPILSYLMTALTPVVGESTPVGMSPATLKRIADNVRRKSTEINSS
jgi:hypothetical protein